MPVDAPSALPHIMTLPYRLSVWRMSRLTRDGTAKPVSRNRILRREGGQENIHFTSSADNEKVGNHPS